MTTKDAGSQTPPPNPTPTATAGDGQRDQDPNGQKLRGEPGAEKPELREGPLGQRDPLAGRGFGG